MDDLRRQFAELDLRAPDLWSEIEARAAGIRAGGQAESPAPARRPLLLFAAAAVLATVLATAFAMGAGLIRIPPILPPPGPSQPVAPSPIPTARPVGRVDHDEAWAGSVRSEDRPPTASVPFLRDIANGRLMYREPTGENPDTPAWGDLALIDVQANPTSADGGGVAIYFELAGPREDPSAVAAYGVVVDADGDGVPDYRIGMDNMAGPLHREWISDLSTGEASINDGGDGYGWQAFGIFADTYFPGHEDALDKGHLIASVGDPGVRFYVWASLIDGEGNVVTDYAPDAGWFEFFPNRSCRDEAC